MCSANAGISRGDRGILPSANNIRKKPCTWCAAFIHPLLTAAAVVANRTCGKKCLRLSLSTRDRTRQSSGSLGATFENDAFARSGPTSLRNWFTGEVNNHIEILNHACFDTVLRIAWIPMTLLRAARFAAHKPHDLVTTSREKCTELSTNESACTSHTKPQRPRAEAGGDFRMAAQVFARTSMPKRKLPREFAL